MKRDGDHLWPIVAATVRPFPGRSANASLPPRGGGSTAEGGVGGPSARKKEPPTSRARGPEPLPPYRTGAEKRDGAPRPPDPIEPNRFNRLTRSHAPTIDLHNLNQDRARAALTAFILRAHAEGHRTVLVITGKGALGDGVLRRRTPEWLAEPPLRAVIAGLSEAHRRHGGAGALYVALKRGGR
jgi:DNA-nicking Smr family endonuclease